MRIEGLGGNRGGFVAAMVVAGLFLAGSMTVSCSGDEAVAPRQDIDSLKAVVEGLVLPANAKATVTLSRGDTVVSTVTRDGYFQAAGIEYGLYIMDVKAPGYGGARSMVRISSRRAYVEERLQEDVPWPVSRISPSDSLILGSSRQDSMVEVIFARYMDRASVEKAFRIDPPSKFRLEWNPRGPVEDYMGDILLVTFFPSDLDFGKSYRVALDSSAATEEGDRLDGTLEYTVRRTVANPGRDFQGYFLSGIFAGPADTIRIGFPRAVDEASIMGRIVLDPAQDFHGVLSHGGTRLSLIPETRWNPGGELEASIRGGYLALDGTEGGPFSGTFVFDWFGLVFPDASTLNTVADELDMAFNLPVDMASLEFRMDSGATAVPTLVSPQRIRWSFQGLKTGNRHTLRIDALHSVHGDTLPSPFHVKVVREAPAAAFRFLDSSQASEGLGPFQDTLRLAASWSAYQRLKSATLSVAPFYPFTVRWTAPVSEEAQLHVIFQNPVPADKIFKLFPTSGAVPGDTLSFATSPLVASVQRPFYGETRVRAGEPVSIGWNTYIDTVEFASKISFEPSVDTVWAEHVSSGSGHRTIIRHSGFAPGTEYRVKVRQVTDLFSRPQRDSLEIRFRTAP